MFTLSFIIKINIGAEAKNLTMKIDVQLYGGNCIFSLMLIKSIN